LRQKIFLHAPTIGWLFERKEHLAFGVALLAWAGAAAYVGAERVTGEERLALRTVAFRAYALGAALAAAVATMGTVVASYASP
jgi:hypothetical protein